MNRNMVSIFKALPQRSADFSSWLLARADEFTLEALQVTEPVAAFLARVNNSAAGTP
jgi:hypothetical protein